MKKITILIFVIFLIPLVKGANCDPAQTDLGGCACDIPADLTLNGGNYQLTCTDSNVMKIFAGKTLDLNGSRVGVHLTETDASNHFFIDARTTATIKNGIIYTNFTEANNGARLTDGGDLQITNVHFYDDNNGKFYQANPGNVITINDSSFNDYSDMEWYVTNSADALYIYNTNFTDCGQDATQLMRTDETLVIRDSRFESVWTDDWAVIYVQAVADNITISNSYFDLDCNKDNEPIIRFASFDGATIIRDSNFTSDSGTCGAGESFLDIGDGTWSNQPQIYHNCIYGDSFGDNHGIFETGTGANKYNITSLTEGNYYNETCTDSGGDGVCDDAQNLTASNDIEVLDFYAYTTCEGWVAEDTCTPECDGGVWNIDASDDCTWTTLQTVACDVDIDGTGDLTWSGNGKWNMTQANWYINFEKTANFIFSNFNWLDG